MIGKPKEAVIGHGTGIEKKPEDLDHTFALKQPATDFGWGDAGDVVRCGLALNASKFPGFVGAHLALPSTPAVHSQCCVRWLAVTVPLMHNDGG